MRWLTFVGLMLSGASVRADVIYVQQTASTSIPYYGYQPIRTYYTPVYYPSVYPSYAPSVVSNTVQQSQVITINNYYCKEATPSKPVKKPVKTPQRRVQLYDE